MPQWKHLPALNQRSKAMNILFCSVGRRCELLKDFRKTLGDKVRIVVTDNSPYAPALAFSDVSYKVPLITDENYIPMILDICKKEKINAITTLIDPEISILADHRAEFEALGVEVLAPYKETADLCFDKYEMFKYLSKKGVRTVRLMALSKILIRITKKERSAFQYLLSLEQVAEA